MDLKFYVITLVPTPNSKPATLSSLFLGPSPAPLHSKSRIIYLPIKQPETDRRANWVSRDIILSMYWDSLLAFLNNIPMEQQQCKQQHIPEEEENAEEQQHGPYPIEQLQVISFKILSKPRTIQCNFLEINLIFGCFCCIRPMG
jgi:hypothetical protein